MAAELDGGASVVGGLSIVRNVGAAAAAAVHLPTGSAVGETGNARYHRDKKARVVENENETIESEQPNQSLPSKENKTYE